MRSLFTFTLLLAVLIQPSCESAPEPTHTVFDGRVIYRSTREPASKAWVYATGQYLETLLGGSQSVTEDSVQADSKGFFSFQVPRVDTIHTYIFAVRTVDGNGNRVDLFSQGSITCEPHPCPWWPSGEVFDRTIILYDE